ncbi:hypothetical protein Mh1961_13460 [Mannheimia haemolytica]
MDKLNAISLFCKVIETQSFTQAAQQAQISLPMASKLVAQLEEHLNVRLLQRTTRKITPTEAGLLYYQQCLPILNELKEADASVSNINSTLHRENNNVCTNGFWLSLHCPLPWEIYGRLP